MPRDAFRYRVNIGETGGQTVPHLHVHLIPRYGGDVRDPRGGIRHVLPARANYLESNDLAGDRVLDRSSATSYRRSGAGWTLAPVGRRNDQGLVLWESYSREQIPKLFGMRSSPQWQQSGFIFDEKAKTMVLLVTLEKSTHPEEHRYEDRFLSLDTSMAEPKQNTAERQGRSSDSRPPQARHPGPPVREENGKSRPTRSTIHLLRGVGFCELGGREADHRDLEPP